MQNKLPKVTWSWGRNRIWTQVYIPPQSQTLTLMLIKEIMAMVLSVLIATSDTQF